MEAAQAVPYNGSLIGKKTTVPACLSQLHVVISWGGTHAARWPCHKALREWRGGGATTWVSRRGRFNWHKNNSASMSVTHCMLSLAGEAPMQAGGHATRHWVNGAEAGQPHGLARGKARPDQTNMLATPDQYT